MAESKGNVLEVIQIWIRTSLLPLNKYLPLGTKLNSKGVIKITLGPTTWRAREDEMR